MNLNYFFLRTCPFVKKNNIYEPEPKNFLQILVFCLGLICHVAQCGLLGAGNNLYSISTINVFHQSEDLKRL